MRIPEGVMELVDGPNLLAGHASRSQAVASYAGASGPDASGTCRRHRLPSV